MVNQAAVQEGQPARPVMCDFGAAYCYDRATSGRFWEAMEMRAFGLFMQDMVARTNSGNGDDYDSRQVHQVTKQQLEESVRGCLAASAIDRPRFSELESELASLMQVCGVPVLSR